MANSIMLITPFKRNGIWAFDDEARGLQNEPFVGEINDMLDILTAEIPNAEQGVNILFSDKPFPGHQATFRHSGEDGIGNYYISEELGIEGWLCPALLKYFETPPKAIYAQFKQADKPVLRPSRPQVRQLPAHYWE